MLMNFEQQQQQIELQNVELAKQLQVNYKYLIICYLLYLYLLLLKEEEEANKMARKAINEQLSQDDSKIAAAIQEDVRFLTLLKKISFRSKYFILLFCFNYHFKQRICIFL